MRLWSGRYPAVTRMRGCRSQTIRCRSVWLMRGWSAGSWRRNERVRVEQVVAVIDSVTCGNRVNLGTRTAPAERANVREIRGLTTTTFRRRWLT